MVWITLAAALVVGQVAHATCSTSTFDFDDGTLQGWSRVGSYSLSNSGGQAYIYGDASGCSFNGMYMDFSGGDSIDVSYTYAASSGYSSTTNQALRVSDGDTGANIFSEYAYNGGGSASGSYSRSMTSEIAGLTTVRIAFGLYDCWSHNWGQTNRIDNVSVTVCSTDFDGDGYTGAADGGTDCDDLDAAINPGALELCDAVDNDCDGSIDEDDASDALTWYADGDGDGFGDASSSDVECYQPSGYVADATDCDDSSAASYPGATETCDLADNDCDGVTDEDDAVGVAVWYADADGDGFGDAAAADIDCYQPSGYVSDSTDCDDGVATTYPGADEYCDAADNDCDGTVDEDDAVDVALWFLDADGDGYGDVGSWDIDCYQPSGYVTDPSDCDDTAAAVSPAADEYCDAIDNDCDGTVDEDDAVDATVWYADADGDGEGDPAASAPSCSALAGYVGGATDCDDSSAVLNTTDADADGVSSCDGDCDDAAPTTFPGADEYCDAVDNDCDGDTDEVDAVDAATWYLDADGDGDGDASVSEVECDQPAGFVATSGDCDDDDAELNVADLDQDGFSTCDGDCDDDDPTSNSMAMEEWYDGVDQDCDGLSDFDQDGDGYDHIDFGGSDCDDEDPDVHIDAEEFWYDGVDQDCDGLSDFDADGDGQDSRSYGGDDCDDADPDVYTGAPDVPYDGVINDCLNADDMDADGDGFASDAHGGDDCDDASSAISPDADEVWYDGVDQDCDGNDDDQDGDGWSVEDDCDDTDPETYPDDGRLDEECLPVGDAAGDDLAGTPAGDGKGGGCATLTGGETLAGHGIGFLLLGLGIRRRRRASASSDFGAGGP